MANGMRHINVLLEDFLSASSLYYRKNARARQKMVLMGYGTPSASYVGIQKDIGR
jgi:hypothetical protein